MQIALIATDEPYTNSTRPRITRPPRRRSAISDLDLIINVNTMFNAGVYARVVLTMDIFTGMGMPKVCAGVRVELVSERVAFVYGTLGDVRHSVVVLGAALMKSVPVDHEFQTVHVVQDVDDYLVSFTDLYIHSHMFI